MRKKIMSMLCCPITHTPLSKITEKKLTDLNLAIDKGLIIDRDKKIIKMKLTDALVTEDGMMLYAIEDGIPVLLENRSISLDQLD
ncbi:hypothetical protein N9X63_03575 [Woeseiaceae bacterium]|jgi:uncharacterized protein|nr:hypothetical protein [Woeseiaceae bacterium]MDB2544132.1 hypothetical protein [Woeseiaceae bacterium]|tara:strand:+ start:1271 stop:1525 length:255 start_codon:yes stop_codon:yes gene_type:complete